MQHSIYGASGFHRIMACANSVRMSRGRPNPTNDEAELGTSAHELGEFCLKFGLNAFECIGLTFNNNVVDAEMAEAVQLYVSFIRDICHKAGVNPMLELRVTILSIGDDVYGTSDCVIIINDVLYVFDYKHGYGVVEVKNNIQAIFYAIATLDTLGLWNQIKTIQTGVIQPRANHIDGAIRQHTYSINEMVWWREQFKQAVANAKSDDAVSVAGEHCRYCLACGDCRARWGRTMMLVTGDKPVHELNQDELITVYEELGVIRNHLNKIEVRAIELARGGKFVEGHKLVNSITRANCEDETGFIKAASDAGVDSDKLFNKPKLISMTNAKKLLDHKLVNEFYIKPPVTTTLVKLTDKRPAISVEGFTSITKPASAVGVFAPVG